MIEYGLAAYPGVETRDWGPGASLQKSYSWYTSFRLVPGVILRDPGVVEFVNMTNYVLEKYNHHQKPM